MSDESRHDITARLAGADAGPDEVRAMYGALVEEAELRGLVRLVERDAEPGALGPLAEAVMVLQAPLFAVVAALVAWIHSRRSEIELSVSRQNGTTIKISAKRVGQLNQEQLASFLAEVVGQLEGGAPGADPLPAEVDSVDR